MTPDGDLIPGSSTLLLISCFFVGFFCHLLPNASPLSLPAARNTLQITVVCHPPALPPTDLLPFYLLARKERKKRHPKYCSQAVRGSQKQAAVPLFLFFFCNFMHISPAPVLLLFIRHHLCICSLIGSDPNRSIKEAVFTSRGSLLIHVAAESS